MRSWDVAHPCTWQAHAEPAGCNPSSWTFPLDVLGGPKRKSLTGLSSCSRPLLHSPSPLRWFLGPEGTHTTRPTHLRRGVPWSPCCLKHLLLWATVEGDQSYGKRQITSSPPPPPPHLSSCACVGTAGQTPFPFSTPCTAIPPTHRERQGCGHTYPRRHVLPQAIMHTVLPFSCQWTVPSWRSHRCPSGTWSQCVQALGGSWWGGGY